jgi:hypothetical protein
MGWDIHAVVEEADMAVLTISDRFLPHAGLKRATGHL